MTPKRNAIEELLAQGMQDIEQSFLMAKAAQPGSPQDDDEDGDLDDDFKSFDQSRKASAAAEGAQGDGGDDEDEDEDEDDEDGDSDWNGGKPAPDAQGDGAKPGKPGTFQKADSGFVDVDAGPLLQAIDDKLGGLLGRLETLEAQNATLAKAVQDSARGNLTIAKAVQGVMGQPMTPKSRQQARVPVAGTPAAGGQDRATVMSKAIQAVEANRLDVDSVAMLEELTNRHGVDAALAALPQVAQIINSQGGK